MTTPTVESLAALGRRLWITTLLWVVGRTLCRAARTDEAVFASKWAASATP